MMCPILGIPAVNMYMYAHSSFLQLVTFTYQFHQYLRLWTPVFRRRPTHVPKTPSHNGVQASKPLLSEHYRSISQKASIQPKLPPLPPQPHPSIQAQFSVWLLQNSYDRATCKMLGSY
jgi:hypothetical protein